MHIVANSTLKNMENYNTNLPMKIIIRKIGWATIICFIYFTAVFISKIMKDTARWIAREEGKRRNVILKLNMRIFNIIFYYQNGDVAQRRSSLKSVSYTFRETQERYL